MDRPDQIIGRDLGKSRRSSHNLTSSQAFLDPAEVHILVLAIGCLLIIVAGPILLSDLPPLLDYPNHLARAVALAAAGTDVPAAQIYQPRWALIPNLGGDLVLISLLQFLPPLAASRETLLILVLASMVGGVIVYARVAFARWTAWSFASPVAAHGGLFLMGFINFCLATGLALMVAAAWTAQRQVRPKLAIASAATGVTVVWFCHIAGALLCMMLIIAREVTSFTEQRPVISDPREVWGRLLGLTLVFLPTIFLYCVADISAAKTSARWDWDLKLLRALMPVAGHYPLVPIGCRACPDCNACRICSGASVRD